MNLELKFNDPNIPSPSTEHTIGDDSIVSYKLSNESFTGNSYFKTKGRTLKISVRTTTWLENHLMIFSEYLIDSDEIRRDYFKYNIQLSLSDDVVFSGHIKNSTISKNKEQDSNGNDVSIITFIVYDYLTVIDDMLSKDIVIPVLDGSSTINYSIHTIIETVLKDALIDCSQYINDENFDDLLNLQTTNTIQLNIGNVNIANTSGWLNATVPNSIINNRPWASNWTEDIRRAEFNNLNFDESTGLYRLYLYRVFEADVDEGHSFETSYGIACTNITKVSARLLTVFEIDGLNAVEIYSEWFDEVWPSILPLNYPLPGSLVYDSSDETVNFNYFGWDNFADKDRAYNNFKIVIPNHEDLPFLEFANSPQMALLNIGGIFGTIYYAFISPYEFLKVTEGEIDITNITFRPDDDNNTIATLKRKDVLKTMLLLKDLALYASINNILTVRPKRDYILGDTIGVNDIDIFKNPKEEQLMYEYVDLKKLFNDVLYVEVWTANFLSDVLNNYYKTLVGTKKISIEILNNNYNLELGNGIIYDGTTYIINEIAKIPLIKDSDEYFSYKINGWETANEL